MVWSLPPRVEDVLWDAARAELSPAALEPRTLAAAIIARSHRYTDERERLPVPVAPRARDADLAARALFFTVADAAKVHVPLAELAARDLVPAGPLRVLDVGAGAGAMSLGILSALEGRVGHITALDRDRDALAILRRAVTALAPAVAIETRVAGVDALPAGVYDLVVVGSVLNELPAGAAHALVRALRARMARGGATILIEPALRETTRALHALRDEVVAAGLAHVFAPCTRQGPCPALADPRDWCHEDRSFAPPPRLAELMHRTGLRGQSLKMAYLTLRGDAEPQVLVPEDRVALRVVSGPLDAKGTVERLVCGPAGRTRLRILRREKGDRLQVLREARRGDVLVEGDGDLSRPS